MKSDLRAAICPNSMGCRRVQTLVQEDQQPQAYELQIDSSNLVSGIYFLRFRTNDFLDVQKLMVIQ